MSLSKSRKLTPPGLKKYWRAYINNYYGWKYIEDPTGIKRLAKKRQNPNAQKFLKSKLRKKLDPILTKINEAKTRIAKRAAQQRAKAKERTVAKRRTVKRSSTGSVQGSSSGSVKRSSTGSVKRSSTSSVKRSSTSSRKNVATNPQKTKTVKNKQPFENFVMAQLGK